MKPPCAEVQSEHVHRISSHYGASQLVAGRRPHVIVDQTNGPFAWRRHLAMWRLVQFSPFIRLVDTVPTVHAQL